MEKPAKFLKDITIHPEFQSRIVDSLFHWRLKTYVDILIVVDTEISTTPANTFGISGVIDLLRSTQVGCMKFRVDIALRSNETFSITANPSVTEPKYRGFRFDSVDNGNDIIDKYEQVWCFGFKPNNSGNADDSIIDQAFAMPATDDELDKLDEWMTEKKGGVFGTGDHHFLGASMCRRIPRLGTMRRWTNADGVPPIGGLDRIDTLRPPPPESDFVAGGPQSLGNSSHQGDLTVQPIKWVAWKSIYWPLLFRRKRPHPVLCHPELGPIDVMADHAHEGLCVPSPDLNASKQFNADPEYPDSITGGPKPAPQIIAYGSNLDSDNWNFVKGEQPGRSNNPMIAVYDGHDAGVGRVATDSTWHHWMDVNINAMKAADNNDWKKISRYFINLAVWLNPPGYSTRCLYLSIIASHFQAPGFQEFHPNATVPELGEALRKHLILGYGPCWVTERIFEMFREYKFMLPEDLVLITRKFPNNDLRSEHLEELVLGHMVKATIKYADNIKESLDKKVKKIPDPEKLFERPIAASLKAFASDIKKQSKINNEVLSKLHRR